MLALEVRDRFLDVGCGSGTAVRTAAARVRRAVGVDVAPAMIERAQTLAKRLTGVEFLVGDPEALPVADASFDALLCSSSFHHYRDPARALAEFARVLAPRDRLALADPSADLLLGRFADGFLRRLDASHVRLYRGGELVDLVEAAGFSSVECRALVTRRTHSSARSARTRSEAAARRVYPFAFSTLITCFWWRRRASWMAWSGASAPPSEVAALASLPARALCSARAIAASTEATRVRSAS